MIVKRALVIVDVQVTFLPGGQLGVAHSDDVIDATLSAVQLGRYGLVIASRERHHPQHCSFAPRGQWPVHAVDGTPETELPPAIAEVAEMVISKGMERDVEQYSACAGSCDATGRSLIEILDAEEISDVDVSGIATNFCVEHTVLDLLADGKRVRLLTFASRGIEVEAGAIDASIQRMQAAGAELIHDPAQLASPAA